MDTFIRFSRVNRKPSEFKEALNRNSNGNRYSEVNSHIALCHERLKRVGMCRETELGRDVLGVVDVFVAKALSAN